MDFLTDWLTDWLKELLISGIMGNLSGLFDNVNAQVGEIAVQVGTTPAAWHAGVFSLIRQLSETVILPIAGMVLTFVATYELIQMLLEKNNMHEFDVANIYKWMFKTSCAILILSNTFNIVMAVFDVSQSVIAQSAGLIQGSTDITPDMLTQLETTLEGMDLGPLLGLWLQSSIIGVTMWALNIIIQVNRAAKTAMEVFDDLLSKEHLDRKDLQLIIEKIKVYEDHLEIRLKADIDCLLRCGELPHEEDFVAAMARQGGTVNFPDGTGDISTITIVQSAKMRPDKVFRANVISNGEGRGMSTPAQWSLSACSSRSIASFTAR